MSKKPQQKILSNKVKNKAKWARASFFGLFGICWAMLQIPFAYGQGLDNFAIHLKEAPLVPTLQYLAMKEKINLIVDNNIDQHLNLTLYHTNFAKLLQATAQIHQLYQWHKDGIYYLSAQQPEDKNKENSDNYPLITMKLHYAKVKEVLKAITEGQGRLLSEKGSISADERSNTLLIKDKEEQLVKIKRMIKSLDQPIKQIAIEARIVTMNQQSLKELGVRWGILNSTGAHYKVAGSLEANNVENIGQQLNVNFGATSATAASAAFQIAKVSGRLLDLELSALEQENAVEIIANPKLLTTNKQSASIKQGTELPYVLTNEKNGTQEVQFKEAVLGLEVTPHIAQNNQILLDLVITQNAPGASVSYGKGEVVAIEKQEINTQVLAQTGETVVLGGIFHDTISQSEDKVPLLGDIPIMKHLFRKKGERHQKRELVIFVTPRIISSQNSEILLGKIAK